MEWGRTVALRTVSSVGRLRGPEAALTTALEGHADRERAGRTHVVGSGDGEPQILDPRGWHRPSRGSHLQQRRPQQGRAARAARAHRSAAAGALAKARVSPDTQVPDRTPLGP